MTHAIDQQPLDLEIRIFPRDADDARYPVEITLDGQQEFPRGYLDSGILPWTPGNSLVEDGQDLFALLFQDDTLRHAWVQSLGQSPRRRIRLRIDPDAAELHALPWELMQEGAAMFSAQAATPFSRYLPIASPWRSAVKERPIRVLVVISNPNDLESRYDLPPVNVDAERESLTSVFAALDAGELQAEFLPAPVTLERLEEALRAGVHLLHFVGHGAFSTRRGKAMLYMQDERGAARRIEEDTLAGLLARQGVQPGLVTLVACQSAQRSTLDAFAGLGPRLVSVGVPAVVAMQDVVTVETARKFGTTFYRRLLAHGCVDLAMNEARSTLLSAGRPDAAVPVLFMRLQSGQLWSSETETEGVNRDPDPQLDRRADLESRIRDSYRIIRDYERTIQFSDRPEEVLRGRHLVDEHWNKIQGYLGDYKRLTSGMLPLDIADIAAHFPEPVRQQASSPVVSNPDRPASSSIQKRRIQQRIKEAEDSWEMLNKRVEAVKRDLRMALDGEREAVLRMRLQDLEQERDAVELELERLEGQL